MWGELLLRFAIGGVVVSLFAAAGEVWKPKTFSGLFGAAPSVALATLALAFVRDGPRTVCIEARWMLVAVPAFVAYGAVVAALVMRRRVPVWLVAGAAWLVWIAIAGLAWLALRGAVAT
jgi:hypothetical protein